MAKHLVIVESPTKARTMKRYLGSEFDIGASMGHVRDLPVKEFGVDIDHDFEPSYEITKGRKKLISALKKKARDAELVYLAPDPDREGEAIAWHLKEALALPDKKVRRVTFEEFTKSAIRQAFANPGSLRMDLVNAQQTRRILDRIVGYKISPLLWKHIQRGLSAGRVQSVAVRMIVDREKEIRAFEGKPRSEKEYWTVKAIFSRKDRMKETFEAELKLSEKKELKTEHDAQAVLRKLPDAGYRIASIEQKDVSVKAPPPFSTDLLLRAASVRLRFSSKRTMLIAQQLYEGIEVGARGTAGLITYMRTDSYNLSTQALTAARDFIEERFGEAYLPSEPNVYRSGAGAQEAHEAIRATDVTLTPEEAEPYLTRDQWRLYDLIWRRFVASQMPPARYKNTVVEIPAADRVFESRGKQQLFDGYTRVLGRPDKDQILPRLEVGNELHRHDLVPEQHFEQPPARYTEATLIGELKRQGIGRPSTYSPIISTIQARKYVVIREEEEPKQPGAEESEQGEEEKPLERRTTKRKRKRRKFHPTALGEVVTDLLVKHFPRVLDLKFTSQMEENLDKIAEEGEDWLKVLRQFWEPFAGRLKDAEKEMKVTERQSEYKCPNCRRLLVYKFARGEQFLGCSGYPECTYTAPVDAEGKIVEREGPEMTEHDCPKCGKKMVIREGRYGKFYACSGYPECKTTMEVGPQGEPVEKKSRRGEPTDVACPKCGKPMLKKTGRRGPFLACSGYPKCRTTMDVPKEESEKKTPAKKPPAETVEQKCPTCGSPMVKRMSRRGPFLGCSAYPKCKTTMDLPDESAPAKKKPGPELTDIDCPECGRKMVIREGRYGKFLACSGYPKCKTTRRLGKDGKPAG